MSNEQHQAIADFIDRVSADSTKLSALDVVELRLIAINSFGVPPAVLAAVYDRPEVEAEILAARAKIYELTGTVPL